MSFGLSATPRRSVWSRKISSFIQILSYNCFQQLVAHPYTQSSSHLGCLLQSHSLGTRCEASKGKTSELSSLLHKGYGRPCWSWLSYLKARFLLFGSTKVKQSVCRFCKSFSLRMWLLEQAPYPWSASLSGLLTQARLGPNISAGPSQRFLMMGLELSC